MKTLTALLGMLALTGVLTPFAGAQTVSADQLVLLPVPNDPTVSFRLWFRAGAQNDPAGKEGLAAITAAMVSDASTKKNSYEKILDLLFPIASGYDGLAGTEMTVISGRTHGDNLELFTGLLMDAVLQPAFLQADLDRIRSRVLNRLENEMRFASDEELGKALLHTGVFAGTPYGHITDGTVEAVKSITLDDIRNFYTTHYTRDNLVIGLGGGYSPAFVERLRKELGALPAGTSPAVPPPSPKPLKGISITMVEKDAPATAISIGFPIGVLRGSREWYALAIANSWLGEHRNSSSHLYQVIREARGLNYGDYSYIEHFPNGGRLQMPPQNACRRSQLFEIWIRPVPNETRHFALRAALREFTRLVENGMSAEDFALTRGFLKKYVLHYAPTTMARLGYALDDRFYGVKGSHLEMFRRMMDEITLEEVNAAIRKHWQAQNMHIGIVTKDAEAFAASLVADTPSPITYSTPKAESVMTEDKEIMVFPVKVRREDVKILRVEEVFAGR